MIETCLKCGHANTASTGSDTEACPQCGAIYSKVQAAMAAKQAPQRKEQGKNFWAYAVLGAMLAVLIPLTIYEETWGTTAKHRKSEASLKIALADQRVQALEDAAKARSDATQQAISQGRVAVGMTADQVHSAWGRPTSVNRTVSASNTHEQWVYRRGNVKTNYVYLDGGVVRSFQVSE